MSDDGILRQKVREAMEMGRLPTDNPVRTWGGRGCGGSCAICGERVELDDVEFELEFKGNGKDTLHVHLRCFSAWEFERHEARSSQAELSQSVMTATGLSGMGAHGTMNGREHEPRKRGTG